MINHVHALFDDNAPAQAAPDSDADGSVCDAGCSACKERWLNAERGIAQMAKRLNAAGIPALDADDPLTCIDCAYNGALCKTHGVGGAAWDCEHCWQRNTAWALECGRCGVLKAKPAVERGLTKEEIEQFAMRAAPTVPSFEEVTLGKKKDPRKYVSFDIYKHLVVNPKAPPPLDELRKQTVYSMRAQMLQLRGFITGYFGDENGLAAKRMLDMADDVLKRINSIFSPVSSGVIGAAPPLSPSEFRKARGAGFGKSDAADALSYAVAAGHQAAPAKTSSDDAIVHPLDQFHIAATKLAALRTEIEDRETVPDFVRLAVNETIELLHPLGMAAINQRVVVLPPDTDTTLRVTATSAPVAPPPGNEPDAGPLMISCDSTYRAASAGDRNDWCNRTFVARMGDTVVASLNVMGYDDDAFDLTRCAVAGWELPSKSWGPHKADDLLARTAGQRTVVAPTYLSRRLVQVLALLQPEVVPSDVVGAREIIREVANRLATLGEASSFDADRQQYIDIGNGELHVGDADYWRAIISTFFNEAPMLREKNKTLIADFEKLSVERDDLRQWVREVLLDTRHWLTGGGDDRIKRNDGIDGIPQDYTRIAYAVREINCALEAFGGSKPRSHEGMHVAASAFLFGLGWGWRSDGMWKPTKRTTTRLFCTQEQLDDAARFKKLSDKCCGITYFDFATKVGAQFMRGKGGGDFSGDHDALPATLTELADRLT